jgi:hypothetical protein
MVASVGAALCTPNCFLQARSGAGSGDERCTNGAGAPVRTKRSHDFMLQHVLFVFRPSRWESHAAALGRQIVTLERKIPSVSGTALTELFEDLGDLCLEAGQQERALAYFGRGIDAHLDAGHPGAAAVLCRKVIALVPSVVRTRCTLAFLSLERGQVADAEREIAEYLLSARAAGMLELAATQLRLMANVTDDHEIRRMLARHLAELGDIHGSNEIFSAVYAERNGLQRPLPEDQRARWLRVLRVAITGPLKQHDAPSVLAAK